MTTLASNFNQNMGNQATGGTMTGILAPLASQVMQLNPNKPAMNQAWIMNNQAQPATNQVQQTGNTAWNGSQPIQQTQQYPANSFVNMASNPIQQTATQQYPMNQGQGLLGNFGVNQLQNQMLNPVMQGSGKYGGHRSQKGSGGGGVLY